MKALEPHDHGYDYHSQHEAVYHGFQGYAVAYEVLPEGCYPEMVVEAVPPGEGQGKYTEDDVQYKRLYSAELH